MSTTLVTDIGTRHGGRWSAPADPVDRRALRHVVAPVLDIGCGPGRHTLALAEAGIVVLGIDVTPHVLSVARTRDTPVLERCVFGRVPGAGRWSSALLLDGNIGIGGDPVELLTRVRSLLQPRGRLIVELARAPNDTRPVTARLVIDETRGPWFSWTEVDPDEINEIASRSHLRVSRRWRDDGRSFAILDRS